MWSWASNHKFLIRLMQKLRVTRKFGDEDVWDYLLNSGTPNVEFVNVRDFQNKVTYAGYVRAFSERTDRRELCLENVKVYELDSSVELFEVPLLYLSKSPTDLHIEFPYIRKEKTSEREENPSDRGHGEERRAQPELPDHREAAGARAHEEARPASTTAASERTSQEVATNNEGGA